MGTKAPVKVELTYEDAEALIIIVEQALSRDE